MQENFKNFILMLSGSTNNSFFFFFWTKTKAGDRQDAIACADRALPPYGVQEATDSSCCEWK